DRRERVPGEHLPHADAPEGVRPGHLPVRGEGPQPLVQGAHAHRRAAQARDRGTVPRPQPRRVTARLLAVTRCCRSAERTGLTWKTRRDDARGGGAANAGPTAVRNLGAGRFCVAARANRKEIEMSWFLLVLAGLLEVVWAVGLKYSYG